MDGLDQLFEWMEDSGDSPAIIRIALTHYQFETLHPFNDGNGRVGRLLIILQMLEAKLLEDPYLTISPWFLRRRDQYQSRLLAVSQDGDWNSWISFFCDAVASQSDAHVQVATKLIDWQNEVKAMLFERNWSGVIAQVADRLVEWPILTNPTIMKEFDVSAPTAKSVTDRLLEIGVIEVLGNSSYRRAFGATAVMGLVESL